MALKPIRTVPTELPQARLYLEDVEEISQLLQEHLGPDAVAQAAPDSNTNSPEKPLLPLTTSNKKGPSLILLQISAPSCDVTIGRISSVRCYSLGDIIPWKLHSSVKQIFDRRKRRLFNFLEPDGIRFALFIVPILSLFIFAKLTAPYNEHFHYVRLTLAFLIVIPPVLMWFFASNSAGQQGMPLLSSRGVQNREG